MQRSNLMSVKPTPSLGREIHTSFSDPPVYALPRRPCLVYHDLIFHEDASPLRFLRFRNHYVARVTVKRRVGGAVGGHRWQTVLRDHALMGSPHSEQGAQDWHTLDVATCFNEAPCSDTHALRFYLYQPSPCWLKFELCSMTAHCAAQPAASVDAPAGGGTLALQPPPELATLPRAKACWQLRMASEELARQLAIQHRLQSHLARSVVPHADPGPF